MATYNYIFNQVELEEVTSIDTYTGEDINLIDSFSVNSSFDQFKNYAELHYYSLDGQVLNSVSNYTNFKSPQDSNTANQGTLDSITLKLEEDLLSEGYDFGDVYLLYNFLNDPYTDNSLKSEFFIEEISPDRFEIRLLSKNLSDDKILKYTEDFKRRLTSSDISDFKLNLGNNRFLLATNIDTLSYKNFVSVVIRLYKQLPQDVTTKTVLTVAETISDSVAFRVTAEIVPDEIKIPYLKGPNFSAGDSLLKNSPTKYFSINELFSYPVTNSYYEVRSLFNEKGVELTIDHTDYSDFIHFSSAKERLENFKYKLDLITLYQSESNAKTNSTGYPNLTASLDAYSGSVEYYNELIEKILANFDHYDRYLYYESSSYAWPKLNSTKPYIIDTGVAGTTWYSGQLSSASLFDAQNPHQLINTIPEFLREDPNNSKYLLFIDMIGQHFDNLWLYAKNITDKYDGDNRINFGISKDLLENALQNFGIRLYTSNKSTQDLFTMFTGDAFSTGSESYVDTVITGSTEIISEENYRKQIYKRLYHNLPYLLKSKGTERGLRALLSIFGIPSLYSSGSHSGLLINQYGGGLSGSFNLGNQYYATSSLGKIRIDNTGSIIPSGSYSYGNTLSRFVSIEKRDNKYTNDLNIIEAGFSPATYLNRFIIASSSIDGFDIDSILGDPRLIHSSSYEGLLAKAEEYLTPVINLANQNNGSIYDLKDFTRLLKFYDNVLFKTLRDFVPARANINTGIIIKPHLLERSKTKQVKPTFQRHNEFTSSIAIGSRSGSHGNSFGARDTYTTSYTSSIITPDGIISGKSQLHEEPKFNGELSGSYLSISTGELNDENRYKYVSSVYTLHSYVFISSSQDAPTPTPTPTITVTPTATPIVVSPTPTPTPSSTPASTTFSIEISGSTAIGVSEGGGDIMWRVSFFKQGEALGKQLIFNDSQSKTGTLPGIESGDEILVVITRTSPDSTPADSGDLSINVEGTYTSITSPPGKSNPALFTTSDSVDGGGDWTWIVNNVDSDTKINVLINEG